MARDYATNGPALELPMFPEPHDGFFAFEGMHQLVAALPGPLYLAEHSYFLNCFDTVIVLAADRWQIDLHPDDPTVGLFLFSKSTTNGVSFSLAATAQDMFSEVHPAWYQQVAEEMVPKSLHDARVCFTAALFRDYLLPQSTTEDTVKAHVSEILRATWQRQSLRFPTDFQVVLLHQVNLRRKNFGTTHTGVLLSRKGGYTYIEKAGGSGPFVRLDVQNTSDLLPWFSFMMKELEHEFTHLFLTLNDTSIESIELTR